MSTVAEKAKPVLRAVVKRDEKLFETAVFVPSANPESRAVLTGQIDLGLGEGRIAVYAFVNQRRDDSGAKFISLTSRKVHPRTGEINYFPVAIGNPVNYRQDGSEVFFDTVIFNPVNEEGQNIPGAQPVTVWVTDACDEGLHAKLGFTSPRVQRPKKAADEGVPLGDEDAAEQAAMDAALAQATGAEHVGAAQ